MTAPASHEIVEIEQGALLLDLRSGVVVRLNRTAALVWRQRLAGVSPSEIAEWLAQRFGLTTAVATRDTALALETSSVESVPAPDSEFHYERSTRGYTYLRSGKALLEIDEAGGSITRAPGIELSPDETRNFLWNVTPKVLSLRGHVVLHAAAVAVGSSVIAFAGASGAGKTTTARALVRAGAHAVAEDKLILRLNGTQVQAAIDGESRIRDWVARAAPAFDAGQPVACQSLDVATQGSSLPVSELGFVDVTRRRPGPVSAKGLGALEAAGTIFQRAFLLSDAEDHWIRQLRASATIGGIVAAYELEMPDDLEALETEALRIVARSSLREASPTGARPR